MSGVLSSVASDGISDSEGDSMASSAPVCFLCLSTLIECTR